MSLTDDLSGLASGSEVTYPAREATEDGEDRAPVLRSLPPGRPAREVGLVNPPRPCEHGAADLMFETYAALIEDEPPRREVRLKAICRCGVDVAVSLEGRRPRDGSLGVVLELSPQA